MLLNMMSHGFWFCFCFLTIFKDLHYTQVEATNKCDSDIIKGIEAYWTSVGKVPDNIIKKSIYNTPENVQSTSAYYYKDQDNISCVYSIFADNGFSVITQFNNRSTSGEFIPVYEEPGYLVNPENGDLRYHITLDDFGVTTFYKCSNDEQAPEGSPEGVIKTSRGFDPKAIKRGEKVLESLGIKIAHEYESSCNPCYATCRD